MTVVSTTESDTASRRSRVETGFWHASPEARLLRHPFEAYEELEAEALVDDTPRWQLWLRRPARLLVFLGVFVALSTAGRLVLWHVALAFVFWAFVPLYQSLAAALTVRLFKRDADLAKSVDLFYMGHGPWYALLAFLVAVCFAAPEVYEAFRFLAISFILPGLVLGTMGLATVLTYAFFRSALGLSRGRSFMAMVTYYGLLMLAMGSWYLFTGQLLPALPGGAA